MKVEIQAGAKFETLTPTELRDILAGWQTELYRGVKYRHPGFAAAASAGGVLAVTPDAGFGPAEGFVWEVTRLTISGLTAAQTVSVFVNDTSGVLAAGTFTATANTLFYGQRGLILAGGDRLVLAGTGLTASGAYPIAAQVTELPVQLAARLL